MTPCEINSYVGIPYIDGSFGPKEVGFNCWGLLHYVQENHYGVRMPKAPIGDADACVAMHTDHLVRHVWEVIQFPVDGCGALLRGGRNPHVGVYLSADGGGILHALEGAGVVFTPLSELPALGFGRTKFYRLSNECESGNPQEPLPRPS